MKQHYWLQGVKKSIDMDDFEEAKDKVIMGVQRKSMILSDKEKETTAYHEAIMDRRDSY